MRKYSYHGFSLVKYIYLQVGGWLAILIFASLGLFLLIAPFFVTSGNTTVNFLDDPRLPPVCFGLIFLIGALNGGSLFINSLPTIWIDDNKLVVSCFTFFRCSIKWEEVINIDRNRLRGYTLIRARRITPFHYVIGWIYSRSFVSAFLISENISNYIILIQEIQARANKSSSVSSQ